MTKTSCMVLARSRVVVSLSAVEDYKRAISYARPVSASRGLRSDKPGVLAPPGRLRAGERHRCALAGADSPSGLNVIQAGSKDCSGRIPDRACTG